MKYTRHEKAFYDCPGAWYGNPGQNLVVATDELDAALRFLLKRYRVTHIADLPCGNMEPDGTRISIEPKESQSA